MYARYNSKRKIVQIERLNNDSFVYTINIISYGSENDKCMEAYNADWDVFCGIRIFNNICTVYGCMIVLIDKHV